MINIFSYNTKIGQIKIEENGMAITKIYFVDKDYGKEIIKINEMCYWKLVNCIV
jgi:methylated-DNA-[protein]-cysteine S-methyltransferase